MSYEADMTEVLEALADLEHEQWAQWTDAALDLVSDEEKLRLLSRADLPYEGLSRSQKSEYRAWVRLAIKAAKDTGARTQCPPDRIDELAALEHEHWGHWIRYMLSNMTPSNVARWERQIATDYADLSEAEKDSDREWAQKVLDALTSE